jgi:signal transduction histidine kinase
VVTTFAEITEMRTLQAELAVAARLAAMGTLLAGAAHEINNPLAVELGNQALALTLVREVQGKLAWAAALDRKFAAETLAEAASALEDAQEGGQRIARIMKELSSFARGSPERSRVRLVDVVEKAAAWMRSSVELQDHGAPEVLASADQIGQVVTNLLGNAARATTAGTGGRVVIRLGPGGPGMARLEIIARGSGIEPAVMKRIFDPFFTTRTVGKGMGLGLSVAHAIVVAHGGTLTVESEVGKGSTFRMELPGAPPPA